jgi:DNA primase
MDAAQEVKSRLDIADVVGEYLPLKPAGTGSFKARCPFHNENSPSFYVNRQRQSWHCFGCDKGGDVLSFVMDMEGMGFRDALEHLAQKAGVVLPERSPADVQRSDERKRLYDVNDLAARYFRAMLLQSPEAEHARTYATSRNIDDLTGDLFRIGYAPKGWDGLTNALIAKGVTADELIRAGLSIKNEERGSVYDRFRDRLMFTIQDVHGNVVGFTGRLLDPNAKDAKYVNTPETAIYKKSMVLYGLDKAKGEIKRQNLAVIVEGNMDVVSSHRAGITNVVCSSGTALTDEQLHLIQRFTKNLAIAFDADAAGMAATLRGLDLARAQDFNIKLITLPPEAGKDPDEAVTKNPVYWKDAIAHALDVMDWVFRAAFKSRNLGNPDDKKKIAADVLPEVRRITDPVVRDHWITKLADGLSISPDALREAIQQSRTSAPMPRNTRAVAQPTAKTPSNTQADRQRDLGERILSLFVLKPELIKQADEGLKNDLLDEHQLLYSHLGGAYTDTRSNETTDPGTDPDESLKRLVDYLAIRADRDFTDQSIAALTEEFQRSRQLLRQFHIANARHRLEQDMRAAELAGDHQRIAELASEFSKLTNV